jgi:hypothetical protein
MRVSMDLRPTRLLVGFGALALAAAVGAGMASTGGTGAAPAAPALADDATVASSALGLGDETSLVAAAGLPGTLDGSTAAAAPRGPGLLRLIIGRTERAEITVTTADGQKTILYVRGKITAASSKSVTITLTDGTTQTFALDSTTRVRGGGKPRAISDIAAGGRGLVLGLKNADGSYAAKFVRLAIPKATTPNPAGTAAP